MMTKIAFLAANREKMPDPVVPIGLFYIMASVPSRHDRMLWDLCFAEDPLATLRTRLEEHMPDVLAISIRNLHDNAYGALAKNLEYYRQLMAIARHHSNAVVVMGGAGFSVMPEQLMRELKPDFGIAGEGEARFARLLDHLETQRPLCDGIYRWENGRLFEPLPVTDFVALDELPAPDRSMVDPRYFSESGTDSVQTKRGCALKCAHCTYPRIEGRRVRLREPATVVDELLRARAENPAIAHVFIVDAVFNIPASHAKAICREMIRRGYDTPWTCYANPRGFDLEVAELMVEAGCTGVEVGTDSGCNAGLERLRKGFTTRDVEAMHALCKRVGLRDCQTFMLATPGESVQQVEETLRFCSQLDPFAAIFMIWTDDSATDQPHSEITEQARLLLTEQAAHHPRWIVPALDIHFDRRLFRALRRQGFTGPLWQQIDLSGVGLR